MAIFSLATSSFSMAATFLLVGVLIGTCGIAEGQSIHVSFRITIRDPLPSLPPDRHSSHIFGRTARSPEELRPVSSVHVNLRLTIKLLLQMAADPSAADAWVQRNIRNQSPHLYRVSIPSEENIPFGQESHVLSAMQNIFDSLAAAGLQDQVRLSKEDDQNSQNNIFSPSRCSCGHDAHTATRAPTASKMYQDAGGPREISIPMPFFTSPSDVPYDQQARYRNPFDAYDQNGGSNVRTVSFGEGPGESISIPTVEGRKKSVDQIQRAKWRASKRSGRATEEPERVELHKFEPVYGKKQPEYQISFA
ncbi:lichenase-like [Aristolochia californica]|uniref:lichenase-like n=1 Tax=Aristolochia californica TaxID=171875 RepID=UPI0035E30FDF